MIAEHSAPVLVPYELLYQLEHAVRLYAADGLGDEGWRHELRVLLDPAYLAGDVLVSAQLLDRTEHALRASVARLDVDDPATAAGIRARLGWLLLVRTGMSQAGGGDTSGNLGSGRGIHPGSA
jgi:hypothetical protein